MIRQGEVYWISLGHPKGSAPGYRHPCVVVQNDVFNKSAIQTVAVCMLTTNPRLAGAPGNVALRKGEASLPKTSVVNVSQILTLDKEDFVEKIGQLSKARIREIMTGLELLLEPRDV